MIKSSSDIDIDDLNYLDYVRLLWHNKIIILSVSSLFLLLSTIYALNIPNKYISTTLLAPVKSENSMVSRMGSLSSLASLSGVNLSNGNSSATNEALERIKTYDFFLEHFLKNIKLEDLTAVKTWDEDNNKLIYDNELYDENLSEWKIKQISLKPTAQEAFIKYNEILTISQDKDNQFVRLSVEHFSPHIAKQWVDLIVNKIDESIREYDKKSAELSISYLNNSSNSTSFQSLKDSIASLLENQMQILMLASSNKSYVFKTLDSALIPEQKSSPNRVQILVLGTLLGFMMSISFILLSHFYMEYKKNITHNEGLK